MFSLTEILRRREMRGQNTELKSWLKERTRHNIINDNCLTQKMTLETEIKRLGRCNDWVAILDNNNRLSLYDIARQKKVWSLTVEDIDGYDSHHYDGLKVTHDGLVFYMATRSDNKYPDIQFFFQGEKIGGFWIDDPDFLLSSLRIIENRIFGISLTSDVSIFYEWNTTERTPVRSMTINDLNVGKSALTDCSNKYYVVSAQSKRMPVFVFNLVTNKEEILNLVDKGMKIESIFLMKDRLICGIHYDLMGQPSIPTSRFPEIRIFNIETGSLESQYFPESKNGKIYSIIANDRYIVFFHHEMTNSNHLYCVNRKENTLKKIKSFPWVRETLRDISFESNFLRIDYRHGYWNDEASYLRRCIIDLDKFEEAQEVRYRYPFKRHSFENGKFLACHGNTLFIEDFTSSVGLEEKPDPENSMRMRPTF